MRVDPFLCFGFFLKIVGFLINHLVQVDWRAAIGKGVISQKAIIVPLCNRSFVPN